MPFPHSFPFPLGAFYEQNVKVAVKSSTKRKYGFLRIITPLLGVLSSFVKNSSWHKKFTTLEGILVSLFKMVVSKRRLSVKIGAFKILNLLKSITIFRYKSLSLGLKTTKLNLLQAIRYISTVIGSLSQLTRRTYLAIRYILIKMGISTQDIDSTYHHLIYVFIRHFDILLGINSIINKLAYSLRTLQFHLGLLTKRGQGRYFKIKTGIVGSMNRLIHHAAKFLALIGGLPSLSKIFHHIRRFIINLGLKEILMREKEGVWLNASIGIKMVKILYRRLGQALWEIARKLLFIKR